MAFILGSHGALHAASRIALVIGNAAYQDNKLLNPKHDAEDMVEALKHADFEVMHLHNLNRREMARGISEFANRLKRTNAIGLFYYAGHGVEVNGINYLLPLGMELSNNNELAFEAINVQRILKQMEQSRRGLNIVIIDACRNNPFRGFRGVNGTTGIQRMNAPLGSIISSSTASGKAASDGMGRNSPYTRQLLNSMSVPGLRLEQIFKQVRLGVLQATNGRQVPWETSSLTDDFYFYPMVEPEPAPEAQSSLSSAISLIEVGDTTRTLGPSSAENLLVECEVHFDADRLVTGEAGGALACYKEVLKIHPGHLGALQGLSKIENKYIAWAERDIKNNRPIRAQYSLDRLRGINPEHRSIFSLEDSISALQNSDGLSAKLKSKPIATPKITPVANEKAVSKVIPEIAPITNDKAVSKAIAETAPMTNESPVSKAIPETVPKKNTKANPKQLSKNIKQRPRELVERSRDISPTEHSNQFRGPTKVDDEDCKICDVGGSN